MVVDEGGIDPEPHHSKDHRMAPQVRKPIAKVAHAGRIASEHRHELAKSLNTAVDFDRCLTYLRENAPQPCGKVLGHTHRAPREMRTKAMNAAWSSAARDRYSLMPSIQTRSVAASVEASNVA